MYETYTLTLMSIAMYSGGGGGGGGRIPVVVNKINCQWWLLFLFYVKVCMVCRVSELLKFYIVP